MKEEDDLLKVFARLQRLVVGALIFLFLTMGIGWWLYQNPQLLQSEPEIPMPEEPPLIQVSVEESQSIFAAGEHQLLVIANCTGCHSGKLVTQNRATREGWRNMIRWMQETQNLRDLGTDEEKILDYLAKHYAPAEQGRRQNLVVEEWYELE